MSLLEIMPYLAISFGGYEYLKERLPRADDWGAGRWSKERLPRTDDEGAGRWSAVTAAPPAPCLGSSCRV